MRPEVLAALPELEAKGILPPEAAAVCRRLAKRELLSVAAELRTLFYIGVLLVTGGVGILVHDHLDAIGPVAIAFAIGAAAAGSFYWVVRHAAPFSWDTVPSPHPAFDYVLLMAVLLAGGDLAWIEIHFTPLGASWPWHLLIVSLAAALAAFRWDSRIVFSLSLSTFAAWRGLSIGFLGEHVLFGNPTAEIRAEAIVTGALFLGIGWLLVLGDVKVHFEPIATHLGWIFVLGTFASGMGEYAIWPWWTLALGATSLGLAIRSWRRRHFPRLAFGVVGSYAAATRFVLEGLDDETLGCFWFAASALALLVGLVVANRRLREEVE